MPLDKRSDLVLAFARVLYVNGQATDQTVAATERLGSALGLRADLMPRWGELLLCGEKDGGLIRQVAANPTGVDMDRVASTMRAIDDIEAGRLAPEAALKTIGAVWRAPTAPLWAFT